MRHGPSASFWWALRRSRLALRASTESTSQALKVAAFPLRLGLHKVRVLSRFSGIPNEWPTTGSVESRMGAVAWGLWPTPRFPSHRVAGGSCPPPAPTERSMRIYRTTLFASWFTALQEPATPHMGGVALVSVTASVL